LTANVVYEKTHFVSLIGEAASSAIVPYIGYLKKFGEPLSVALIVTPQVTQWLPGLVNLIKELTPEVKIGKYFISSGFGDGDEDYPSVEATYQKLEDDLGFLAINMMGGMKRQLLAGLFALKGRGHLFLQLSEDWFMVSRIVGQSVHTDTMALEASLPTQKYLELQKIDYRIEPDPPWDLKRLCHEARVPLPEGAMFNVSLGGNRVDCVWSSGGSMMRFLLISPDKNIGGAEALANARNIETLASTKWWTNGLFSRRIFVLEGLARIVDRYEYEVPGLVKSYRVDWEPSHLTQSAKESLSEIFSPPKNHQVHPQIKRQPLDLAPVPTLITAMGRMSDATLLAIVSHKMPQVVLVYTPEDEWVAHMVKVYQDKAKDLGLQRVLLVPSDYTAANVHAHLPPDLAKYAAVNITPGTKPQGLALGLWAKNHGVPSWAIDRDVIRRLDQNAQTIRVRGLSVKTRLDFTLETRVTDYGWGKHSPDWPQDLPYRKLLKFMNLAVEKKLTHRLHHETLEICGHRLECLDPVENSWRFSWAPDDSSPAGSLDLKGGFWYERLTAKAVDALNRVGPIVWDVSCGVEVSIPGYSRHLTERDVLAANSRAQLFMISCKTSSKLKGGDLKKVLLELEAMAKTMGRFVIPVLCHMGLEPPKSAGEAMVIGWPTLCQPKELLRALTAAAKNVHG
jgi:hypothetical protein